MHVQLAIIRYHGEIMRSHDKISGIWQEHDNNTGISSCRLDSPVYPVLIRDDIMPKTTRSHFN